MTIKRKRSPALNYNWEDSAEAAEPLPLSIEDLKILSEMRTRRVTIPIVLLDSLLPGQEILFSSSDPNFEEMIKYVLDSDSDEIGIIGFHPTTGEPLNRGVTAVVDKEKLTYGIASNSKRLIATSFKGVRCFEVVGKTWMDDTKSFYFSDVEIFDNRKELLSAELEEQVKELHDKIPRQIEKWIEWMMKTEQISPERLNRARTKLPDSPRERAIWVGSLMNPTGNAAPVCPEIRPAMLACRNDHDRLVLASAALQSSIDHLSGRQTFE
eukprot:CAMPEP_0178936270 /NCGR_PEP_ID=MMETSP0786-20121207/25082_1 /TAXON_ID=186022 /ORGANISM="Thalassionema frauenfeldii, Strain CCMP 1798" /LENGTH=267 /DNA_ID=CAMNT_0020614659 /DNA_START=310 /DNA_END=1113 /DNA_ORIENTATION=+